MIKIAPSLLAADFAELKKEIAKISQADMLHLDVMDGHFVPNLTFGPKIVSALRSHSDLIFDTHLMIKNPEQYLEDFAAAGSDIITFHVEATNHSHRLVQRIKGLGLKAGISINPATSLESLQYLLPELDLILLMSVNPGFGGQKFIPVMLDKIKQLREIINTADKQIDLAVDGGLKTANLTLVVEAGANVLVAGSAIFGSENPEKTIREFRNLGEDAWHQQMS